MTDPWQTLGLPPDSDEATVRARYLELVRDCPPERDPTRFRALREAYEAARDRDARLIARVSRPYRVNALDGLPEAIAAATPRRRLSLDRLVNEARDR